MTVAESRTKYDTEQRLKTNQAEQRQLNEAAMYAELDLKQKKIDQRIQVCACVDRHARKPVSAPSTGVCICVCMSGNRDSSILWPCMQNMEVKENRKCTISFFCSL